MEPARNEVISKYNMIQYQYLNTICKHPGNSCFSPSQNPVDIAWMLSLTGILLDVPWQSPMTKTYPGLNYYVNNADVMKPWKLNGISLTLHMGSLMTMKSHCLSRICFPICKMGIMNMFFIILWGVIKLCMQNALISSEERVSKKLQHSYYCIIVSSWNCVLRTILLSLKNNSSRKRKQTRNDLIVITPATPKNRHSSEKLNSFPLAMK